MFASKDLFLTQPAGATGYQISRSVRLRSSASAYFNRTPASASNQKTWTWSSWVKRGNISSLQTIFGAYDSATGNFVDFGLFTPGSLLPAFWCRRYNNSAGSNTWVMEGTPLYRDPSAWYHVVFHLNCTSSPTFRAWINGVEITNWTQNSPPTNSNWEVNGTNAHYIGRYPPSAGQYFDGYLTEINFIDGQALTPSSFGATNTTTGVWGPTKYTGTYGNNGFYLNFSDNSSNTATTIGKDYSGNGNNWTPNNISVTAGVTYDSMVDTPTPYGSDSGVGGEVRGNYCTLNPLDISGGTVSNGNLTYVGPNFIRGTITPISGKYYWEVTVDSVGAGNCDIGLFKQSIPLSATTNRIEYRNDGNKVSDGSVVAYGATYTTNNIIGVAADFDNGTITFYKNNASQGTITYGSIVGYSPHSYCGASFGHTYNFGQRAFSYTAPTGYKALNTQNLSTPTIANGAGYMAATLYTGTGASQTIANTVGSANFKPDWVWIKSRSAATDHKLTDSVRGVTKALISDTNGAETTDTNGLTAFGSTGFTVGTDTNYNNNTATYVAWQWLAGAGSSSSNTSGSITSTVSVNTTAGFSVVTYTGTGANATVGHGLGVAPSMVLVKKRSSGGALRDWCVYHQAIGNTDYLILDTTAGRATASTVWNNTSPTSSVISIGSSGVVNDSPYDMVAYCFAAIAGYSAFGSYTGNGSTDGPFVYLGFRPRFVMFKRTDSTGNWDMIDTSRSPYNQTQNWLYANLSNAADDASSLAIDFNSNGFKVRSTNNDVNISSATYVYAAFAENPFKYALAR